MRSHAQHGIDVNTSAETTFKKNFFQPYSISVHFSNPHGVTINKAQKSQQDTVSSSMLIPEDGAWEFLETQLQSSLVAVKEHKATDVFAQEVPKKVVSDTKIVVVQPQKS